MNKTRIEIGDKVNVYFERVPAEFSVEVTYVPQATGDSWYVKRESGIIVAINSFTKMEQVNE
jgi:hypothetical protein